MNFAWILPKMDAEDFNIIRFMDNSIYLNLTKQVISFNNLNVISNNIANAGTAGYKADRLLVNKLPIDDVMYQSYYPNDIATITDFKEGSLKSTSNAMDLAIVGKGFFTISTDRGVRYTRNGAFRLNGENALVDHQGNPVLSLDGQGINFEDGDYNPIVLSDGTIMVDGEVRGVVGVVEFPEGTKFNKEGDQYFNANNEPIAAGKSVMVQGMLEDSNVNTIQEITNLILIQREASTSANLVGDLFSMQRSSFKAYSKFGA